MLIHVLGSGAGGGFPQWNCNCHNCNRLRKGNFKGQARTQSSIAASTNGTDWVLFNASPDILGQLQHFPAIQPGRALRDTGIRGIVLLDSQIDHTTGLLMLREHHRPLDIYCTESVHQDLTTGNPLFKVLEHYCTVNWHPLQLPQGDAPGEGFQVEGIEGLRLTPVPLRSEAPPYSPHRHNYHVGDTIGLWLEDPATQKSLFYAPGLGQIEDHVLSLMEKADCLLIDGTFWTEDEMERAGITQKRATEMGHLPQSGQGGMISVLAPLTSPWKILIHINNTNPILDEESLERAQLEAAGIEVAFDGMDIIL
ncbi:pyrroloquinoline quinone biosynthesis protein PqqB [Nitrosococcus oceani]|uniref:pyrroloquinoline quinone biosynthesis protein PqqB n=1 Tax=Nitrosococcus oceani TaxID=1229 RepID=UPI0004E8A926|nr:pyrroloquinoline quinone biosynthesis protein PqqB [Nitrosococcus oceani]KFI21725.1 pyrroloquinoline quinone biosynthesis protein PqqB [Nitrosococcus oceani]